MCLVHSAALVAEYLVLLGVGEGARLGGGAVALQKVTPNALHESAVSDDVMAPRNEGICLAKDFTEQGLQGRISMNSNIRLFPQKAGIQKAPQGFPQSGLEFGSSNKEGISSGSIKGIVAKSQDWNLDSSPSGLLTSTYINA